MVLLGLTACRLGFDPAEPPGTTIDAAVILPEAGSPLCVDQECESVGGTCINGVCAIARTGESAVTCPAGMPCRIECTGTGRPCRDGASCGDASSCELRCIGYRACQDGASCGSATSCTVTCDGEEACENGITAIAPTTCTSHCCGVEACLGGTGVCTNDAVCN